MHLRSYSSWQISLVFLYALTLAFARTILHTHTADIGFDDESGYLWAGLNVIHAGLPAAENSPLYTLWYWLESSFVRDPIILYQTNWGILLLVTLILLIVALRSAGVSIIGTVIALSCVSIAYYSDIWPYITAFSGALVLIAAIVALRCGKPARAYSAGATVMALATFARPELLLAFMLLLAVAAYHSWREREWKSLIFPVTLFVSCCLIFGAPFGGGRQMVAFGQHFALNIAQVNQVDIDPWNNWQQIVKENFGAVSTPLQALEANPRAFLWHLTTNARTLIDNVDLVLSPSSPTLDDETFVIVVVVVKTLFEILMAVGLIFGVSHARRDEKGQRLLIMLIAILIPFCLTALLIYPRLHYFMAPLAILCVLSGYGWGTTRFKLPAWLLSTTLLPFLFLSLAWNKSPSDLPHLATIQLLRSLPLPPNGKILESDFGRAIYANLNYLRISQMNCDPFLVCLKSQQPTIIVGDERLHNHYVKDDGFRNFSEIPAMFGYYVKKVPDTDIYIFIANQYDRGDQN